MAKKKSNNIEEYQNGFPCGEAGCADTKRGPCAYCGRTGMRGTTIIEDRTGYAQLERMRPVEIKLHNKLSPAEQEQHILRFWRSPFHD